MGQGRRHFTDEFKQEAIALLVSSGRPLSQIASELGISPSMLRNWRNGGGGRDAGSALRPIPASRRRVGATTAQTVGRAIDFALPARRVREVLDSRKLSEFGVPCPHQLRAAMQAWRCVLASLWALAKKIFTEGNSERFREQAKKTKIQFGFLSKRPFVIFVSFC